MSWKCICRSFQVVVGCLGGKHCCLLVDPAGTTRLFSQMMCRMNWEPPSNKTTSQDDNPQPAWKLFNCLKTEQKNRPTTTSKESLRVSQKLSRAGADTVKIYKHNSNWAFSTRNSHQQLQNHESHGNNKRNNSSFSNTYIGILRQTKSFKGRGTKGINSVDHTRWDSHCINATERKWDQSAVETRANCKKQ